MPAAPKPPALILPKQGAPQVCHYCAGPNPLCDLCLGYIIPAGGGAGGHCLCPVCYPDRVR